MSPIRATELPKVSKLAAAVCAQRDEQHKMQMCPHLRMTLSKIVRASWQRDLNQGYLKRRAGGVGLALDFLQDLQAQARPLVMRIEALDGEVRASITLCTRDMEYLENVSPPAEAPINQRR
ncbi:hypothetical protein ABVK25_002532 [Lepraria finkii]|uniref:Uncharacterized protein n=1 Tax=Lepraria finkii TaxID=1340010 RepID=A0ABR4BI31_9LECA